MLLIGWLAQRQPLVAGWVCIAVVLVLGGVSQLRRGRRVRAEHVGSESVVAACDSLVAELAAGMPPVTALAAAVEVCPALAPVVETIGLGGDPVPALRRASTSPGCRDLRLIAASWQVSQRAGVGLGFSLEQLAETLRTRGQSRRVVRTELASARATARLMAGLPLLTWLLGLGTGAAPWSFLLGSPVGLLCALAGLSLALAGLAWIDALAHSVERAL